MAEQVSTGEKVQAHAAERLRQAEHEGGYLHHQKHLAAAEVEGYARALHETAHSLHERQKDAAGGYAERAANAFDRLAVDLRDKDLGEMFDNLSGFAQRQPGVFIGGAVAAGFLLSRIMKGSTEEESTYGFKEKMERVSEKIGEKVSEVKPEQATSEAVSEEPEPETAGEHYTSADIEIPAVVKPHEPAHPGEKRP